MQNKTYNHWRHDLNFSSNCVQKAIAQGVLRKIISGEIKSAETQNSELCKFVDCVFGMDYFRIKEGKVEGIASRFQRVSEGHKPFNTFTLRSERKTGARTEIEKRLSDLDNGAFRIKYVIHGYALGENTSNPFETVSIACVQAEDLIRVLEYRKDLVQYTKSDNEFAFIDWGELKSVPYADIYPEKRPEDCRGYVRVNIWQKTDSRTEGLARLRQFSDAARVNQMPSQSHPMNDTLQLTLFNEAEHAAPLESNRRGGS